MNISSFTSASAFPEKLLCNSEVINSITNNKIIPYHVQINPTNKCNYNCSFCSCKNRDRKLELSWEKLCEIFYKFLWKGMKALTITGGGEPLLYPYINELISLCYAHHVEVGLVTNGIYLKEKIKIENLKKITWCRISISNEAKFDFNNYSSLFVECPIDWAFSYVVIDINNLKNLKETIKCANKYNFTHVRIVDDIIKNTDVINKIKEYIKNKNINDELIIYQGRKEFQKGNKKCLLSLLKPNIGPDGYVYPCCGIQYAKEPQSLDFNINDSMGNDINDIWKEQKYFDGSVCKKCYYTDYNLFMNRIQKVNKGKHKNFL